MTLPQTTHDPDASAEAAATERPSKTQLKKAMHELQDLGEALLALPADRVAALPLSETSRTLARPAAIASFSSMSSVPIIRS